jgi:peptide/nickel transport system substrate-binding protein
MVSRRQFLHAGAGIGATALLSACGSLGGSSGQSEAGPPRPGGTLRVGALGKASSVARDPHGTQSNESDYLILSLLYDTLTAPGEATVAPRLATRWESSPDLRSWRFELAEGVRFHDGRPMTSADVVWSLRRLRESPSGSMRLPGIQPSGIQPDGPGAVVITSDYPNSEVPVQTRFATFVLPQGSADPVGAPGTGPFKLDWFQDGNARLVRNDEWFGDRPLLDAIEVRLFEKPETMANALLTDQIDLASNVGAVAARTAERQSGVQVMRRPDDTAMAVVMRTSDGPYTDPRVRRAFRLAVDRRDLVRKSLSGYGSVANDILGTADPLYAHDLPQRERNLQEANRLLDEAEFPRSQPHQLLTTEQMPGMADSATLFARQLRDVGVNIEVVKQESSTFLGKSKGRAPLYTTYWGTNDSVTFCASKLLLSDSSMNEANWREPAFDEAYRKAISTNDPELHKRYTHDMQEIEYESSGYLLWGMADGVDLAKSTIGGLPKLPGYGRVQLERAWMT